MRAAVLVVFLFILPSCVQAELVWGEMDIEVVGDSMWHFSERLSVKGSPADQPSLESVINRVLESATSAGYAFASVKVKSFDEIDGRVDVVLEVNPGHASYVEGLVLEGAKVTRPSTAMRLARFSKGMKFTGSEADGLREALISSGLFTNVGEVRLLPGAQPGSVVLSVKVSEPPYTRFSGAAGLGRDRALTGMVDLGASNLAGTARDADVRWDSRGNGLTRFFLRYKEPWLPWVPVALEGELSHDVNSEAYSFTRWEFQGILKANHHWFFVLGAGGTRAVETSEESASASETYGSVGAGFDTRDHPLNPSSGFRIRGETRRGVKRLTSGMEFNRTRWSGDAEGYRRVGRRWMGVAGLSARHLDTPESVIPIYDLYPIGGANSLRGYREEQFHTDLALLWKTEWQWLQDNRGSALYGFVDGGWIAGRASDGSLPGTVDTMLLGYGLGVRQAAKAGLFGVEYGVAKGESVLEGRVHVRVAAAF